MSALARSILIRVTFLLVVASLLAAYSVRSSAQATRPAGILIEAQSALDQNHPLEAIDLLTRHLQACPADDGARLLLAEALVMAGRAPAAEEQYQAILKRAPANYIALAGLGELYASTGRWQQAEPLLARAVKQNGYEPQLRVEWAQSLARLHRFQEASRSLTGVTPPAPANERISFFRLTAAVAEGLGNSAAAAADMENALSVHPEDPALRLATAVAELRAKKWNRAATLAGAVLSETQDAEAGLILLEARLAQSADAQTTLDTLRALELPAEREGPFRQRLAEILIAHGDFAEAAIDLSRTVELDPTNSDVRFDLALAQFKAGATKAALASAEKCKELRDSAELESLLGDIQETLGDNLSAVKSYQASVAMAPENENYQLALAVEFIRHRNFDPAKMVLQQSEKLFPRSWRIQVALGMVEYFVGTKPAASQVLLRAAELAPQPELAFRYLGDIELDESAAPDPPAVLRLCSFADAHPAAAREQLYCGALLLQSDYAGRDQSHSDEIIRRLTVAARALPNEAQPHCELGKAYSWIEKWEPAQYEAEACAKLNPDSAQAHYRLSQIYRHGGQTELAREEIKKYKDASQRLAEVNEQHETALNTFLYTIQNQTTR
jgi:tetratricopeptide (TPR) repeat protein